MSGRESYFIRSEGPQSPAVVRAISWLLDRAKTTQKGFIFVAVLENLRSGIVGDVLGEAAAKALMSQGKLTSSGVEIQLVTASKTLYDGQNSPIVTFYPDEKLLDQLDSISNLSAMLVVPWRMEDIELWIKTRNATELDARERQEKPPPLVRSKVVERALKSLTMMVNVSTGLIHPLDRDRAIQTFEILRDAGEPFTPEEVKAWLVAAGGWKATHAQEAADIAKKILEGRKLKKLGKPAWRPDILEVWKHEANQVS